MTVMDNAGIDKAVIFGSDFGPEIGDPPIHVFESNKIYADLVKKHPDRFVALASIDPRRPGALKHCEQCIEEWGMKGFKLHPAAGFYPTDEICWPLYEKCADWEVPLVFHTGGQPAAPVSLDTQRSLFLAEAATRFSVCSCRFGEKEGTFLATSPPHYLNQYGGINHALTAPIVD